VPGAAIGIIGTGVDSTTDADEAGGMPPEECHSLDRHLGCRRCWATASPQCPGLRQSAV